MAVWTVSLLKMAIRNEGRNPNGRAAWEYLVVRWLSFFLRDVFSTPKLFNGQVQEGPRLLGGQPAILFNGEGCGVPVPLLLGEQRRNLIGQRVQQFGNPGSAVVLHHSLRHRAPESG